MLSRTLKSPLSTASRTAVRGVGFGATRSISVTRVGAATSTRAATSEVSSYARRRTFGTTSTVLNSNDTNSSSSSSSEGQPQEGQPKEGQKGPGNQPWIDVLESVADGPWLTHTIPDERMRLAIAHGLVYQLLLYLSRPIELPAAEANDGGEVDREQQIRDAHAQYLSAFAVARVPPTSEMARARLAATKLVCAVLFQFASIPTTSPLHPSSASSNSTSNTTALFQTYQALKDIADAHGVQGRGTLPADWAGFWGHAQPVVVGLVEELDKAGFVLREEGGAEGEEKA